MAWWKIFWTTWPTREPFLLRKNLELLRGTKTETSAENSSKTIDKHLNIKKTFEDQNSIFKEATMKSENEDDLLTQKLTGVDIIYNEISPNTRAVIIYENLFVLFRSNFSILEMPIKDIHWYYILGQFLAVGLWPEV